MKCSAKIEHVVRVKSCGEEEVESTGAFKTIILEVCREEMEHGGRPDGAGHVFLHRPLIFFHLRNCLVWPMQILSGVCHVTCRNRVIQSLPDSAQFIPHLLRKSTTLSRIVLHLCPPWIITNGKPTVRDS